MKESVCLTAAGYPARGTELDVPPSLPLGDRYRFLEGMYSLLTGAMSSQTYIGCEHRCGCAPVRPLRLASLLCALLLLLCGALKAEPMTLPGDNYNLHAQDNGTIELRTPDGRVLVGIIGYDFVWVPIRTNGGVHSIEDQADGRKAIRVVYRMAGDDTGNVRIEGLFTPLPGCVRVRFELWLPEDVKVGGAGITQRIGADTVAEKRHKMGRWTRHAAGGVPYEVPDGRLLEYDWDGVSLFEAVNDNSVTHWSSESFVHCPPEKAEPGRFAAEMSLIVADPAATASEAAARYHNRPLALQVSTDRPFHLWESNAKPLPLDVKAVNTSANARDVELSWWARDFSGAFVRQGSKTAALPPGGRMCETESIPGPSRGILFVEVSLKSGSDEEFIRTTLAVLPPHEFKSGDESIFGIAGYFPLPSEADVHRLLKRMGVRWRRSGDSRALRSIGARANYLGLPDSIDAYKDQPEEKDAYLRGLLETCKKQDNPFLELGNEWNGVEGSGGPAAAESYVKDWLVPLSKIRRETGWKVKVMSGGLSGADVKFLERVYNFGGWEMFDALALHPGRGHYTPDYLGDKGEYWTYLGTIRKVKATVSRLGDKPIWITEAYAATLPNNWWFDSYRIAAENMVLTYALAMAEGIRNVQLYQLHDSVWYDIGGVNEKDMEYHHGLLFRDGSVKPSLPAYCTIAEALDRAKFVRWMKFPDADTKGLLFRTPDGPVAVLWNRADGYVLSEQSENYADPEPWVDTWKTKTLTELPAAGASVRVLNCIGEEITYPARNGVARVPLDGAPRIVYGLRDNGD